MVGNPDLASTLDLLVRSAGAMNAMTAAGSTKGKSK
jgi:hypothetical protein